jgi:hypothetical protein
VGNAVHVVDETADLADAASAIVTAKTFDYATSWQGSDGKASLYVITRDCGAAHRSHRGHWARRHVTGMVTL